MRSTPWNRLEREGRPAEVLVSLLKFIHSARFHISRRLLRMGRMRGKETAKRYSHAKHEIAIPRTESEKRES